MLDRMISRQGCSVYSQAASGRLNSAQGLENGLIPHPLALDLFWTVVAHREYGWKLNNAHCLLTRFVAFHLHTLE